MKIKSEDVFDLMKLLEKEQVSLCFSGPFTQKLLLNIVDSLKASISDNANSLSLINKVFSAVVELTQNIIEYDLKLNKASTTDIIFENGIVLVGKKGPGGYYVVSVNVIETGLKDKLIAYLDQLSGMDKIALKKFYFEKIREGSDTKESGGGVGLVTIIRNATSFSYDVQVENEEYSYFFIKVNFE